MNDEKLFEVLKLILDDDNWKLDIKPLRHYYDNEHYDVIPSLGFIKNITLFKGSYIFLKQDEINKIDNPCYQSYLNKICHITHTLNDYKELEDMLHEEKHILQNAIIDFMKKDKNITKSICN